VIPEADQADVVIVNTCSFHRFSKEESNRPDPRGKPAPWDAQTPREQKLIVAGCMAQRFARELPGAMPEVDAFIGLDQVTQVAPIIAELSPASPAQNTPRKISSRRGRRLFRLRHAAFPGLSPRHFAY